MGLHAYHAEDDTFDYYCPNPSCRFHNCADWEPFRQCAHHDTRDYVLVPAAEMRQRLRGVVPDEKLAGIGDTIIAQDSRDRRVGGGSALTLSASHPDIHWTGASEVQLPPCECGTQMTLKCVYTDEELAAPNIRILQRNADNPAQIDAITQHPMVARHQALAQKLRALGNTYRPQEQTHE